MLNTGAIGYPQSEWLSKIALYTVVGGLVVAAIMGGLLVYNNGLPKLYLVKLLNRDVKLVAKIDEGVFTFIGKIIEVQDEVVVLLSEEERYHLPVSFVRYVVESKIEPKGTV